jgi:hypothetical protein
MKVSDEVRRSNYIAAVFASELTLPTGQCGDSDRQLTRPSRHGPDAAVQAMRY